MLLWSLWQSDMTWIFCWPPWDEDRIAQICCCWQKIIQKRWGGLATGKCCLPPISHNRKVSNWAKYLVQLHWLGIWADQQCPPWGILALTVHSCWWTNCAQRYYYFAAVVVAEILLRKASKLLSVARALSPAELALAQVLHSLSHPPPPPLYLSCHIYMADWSSWNNSASQWLRLSSPKERGVRRLTDGLTASPHPNPNCLHVTLQLTPNGLQSRERNSTAEKTHA